MKYSVLRDLTAIVPGTRTIKYGDLVKSRIATRYSVLNNPSEIQWQNLENLARDIIQPLIDRQKVAISSVFRSIELNSIMRGIPNSDHTLGKAVDVVITDNNIDSIDVIEWIYKNLKFKKIIAEEFPNGWIHISYEKNNNDKKIYLKLKESKNIKETTINELIENFGKKIALRKISIEQQEQEEK